jgi:CDP-paratose 2-epimerase
MDIPYVLITGGAGFIGTNVARSYLAEGQPVHVFDNLSRPGVEHNIVELQRAFPDRLIFTNADVRDSSAVRRAVAGAKAVYHFAAQVAVTTSLEDPVFDLETNLIGTVNVLEAIRHSVFRPPMLFTSTNKVYGKLSSVSLQESGTRYRPADDGTARHGVGEGQPLEFLSPYGCSKGSADQYVLDYAKSYGLFVAVFRMSCIYGPYQMGSEDQGWVAHFLRRALKNDAITIYGDGKQVRDLLYVSDLVEAMRLAVSRISEITGEAFNIGGGFENSSSLLEVISVLNGLTGNQVTVHRGPERLGDQRWYVSDISKFKARLRWSPKVGVREGLRQLHDWYVGRAVGSPQAEVQFA